MLRRIPNWQRRRSKGRLQSTGPCSTPSRVRSALRDELEEEVPEVPGRGKSRRLPVRLQQERTIDAGTGPADSRGRFPYRSRRGAIEPMPRSIQRRQGRGTPLPIRKFPAGRERRSDSPALRNRHESIRVIGQPIGVTLPKLDGVRLRYCSRTEEQPAAILGKSMLRLGISRVNDWTGSAVDFVQVGLARHCQANGTSVVSRVFPEAYIRLLDEIVQLNEYERNQSETVGPSSRIFLSVNYDQAAMVPIGPTLRLLGSVHERLSAAFFTVL